MDYKISDPPMPPTFKYKKILEAGKPTHERLDSFSIKHPAMPLSKRAKIFSPFDALKGFHEAVASKDVKYEKKHELSEEDTRRLDLILNKLKAFTLNSRRARENHIQATITYYVPCEDADNEAYKVKGTYEKKSGTVYRVDSEIYRIIQIDDDQIPIEDIIDIECEQVENMPDTPL